MLTTLTDKVVVKADDAAKVSPGGIYLAGNDEKPETGKVVAIGPEVACQTLVGKTVVFNPYDGDQFQYSNNDYFVFSESTILAVLD
jgi:co-chaperonin GroES (HSP10)